MTNKELAAQCLIEAAELLEEAQGQKGLTAINTNRHADSLKKDMSYLSDNKLMDWSKNLAMKQYDKMLNKHDVKKLENVGKRIRSAQAAYTKHASKHIDFGGDETLSKFVEGVTNKRPIDDKEKMRRSNIKLGYQVAKAWSDAMKSKNESVDIDALLEEAMDLLDY